MARPRRHPGAALLLDPDYARLKAAIVARTGHAYYDDKDDLLVERLRQRMAATGCADCAAYDALLSDPGTGEAEWQALEADITVGETFFFRYAEQFAALRGTILPNIIRRNAASRRIRIWSAGCSNGAEPYSLAILVQELLGDAIGDWRVSILGTDINERLLAAARTAQFNAWALRATPPEHRPQHFTPIGPRWRLKPEYRVMVRFERFNLLAMADGTAPLQFTDFDLILCRNVLIYFNMETVISVVRGLSDRLSGQGWMLLGHAEPNPAFGTFLDTLSLRGTVAYRRLDAPRPLLPADGAGLTARPEPWSPLIPPSPPAPVILPPVPAAAGAATPPPEPQPILAVEDPPAATFVDEARSRADLGDLDGAWAACRAGLHRHPLDPLLHFYDGLTAHAAGRLEEAEAALRRSIYLNRNFVMSHYCLGVLLLATGRQHDGRRALANAAQLASVLPADFEIPEGQGLKAAELDAIARLHLEAPATRKTGR